MIPMSDMAIHRVHEPPTEHLNEEGHTGSELDVLAQLQILQQRNTLDHGVLPVECTVHVGNRLPGQNVC